MADETIGTTNKAGEIVIKGFNPNYIVEKKTNGTDILPGHVVTNYGEANKDDVDLCDAGEPPLGIALEHYFDDGAAGTNRDTLSIGTAYADDTMVRVALIGSGMTCYAYLGGQTTTTTIYAGQNLVAKTSGLLQLPTFATTTAQLNADWLGYVGKSAEYNTGGSDRNIITVVI